VIVNRMQVDYTLHKDLVHALLHSTLMQFPDLLVEDMAIAQCTSSLATDFISEATANLPFQIELAAQCQR